MGERRGSSAVGGEGETAAVGREARSGESRSPVCGGGLDMLIVDLIGNQSHADSGVPPVYLSLSLGDLQLI